MQALARLQVACIACIADPLFAKAFVGEYISVLDQVDFAVLKLQRLEQGTSAHAAIAHNRCQVPSACQITDPLSVRN